MKPENKDQIYQQFEAIRRQAEERRDAARRDPSPTILIGTATCGIASGALDTKLAFEQAILEQGLDARVRTVGCIGHCYAEPVVIIDYPQSGFPPIFYHEVTAGKARMLVKHFLEGGDPLFEHVYGAMVENDMIPSVMEFSRFNQEKRVVMEKCGHIDPEDIYDYIAHGGYAALAKALTLDPETIIDEIKTCGLRGRGGAGFPTGRKWELAADSPEGDKIIVCNADEGDPGAYMDRTILESNPHQVLEGMAICALAVGAHKAIVYVRSEYPLAVKIVSGAIAQAKTLGLLGSGILNSAFNLEIEVFQGSGAFVCGEETGLIQSIEGFRGMPRSRPPYPAQEGLYGQPTVINNVKTLASVPPIIANGAAWYRTIGTENSPGTAVFSVVGDVVSGGCLPETFLDTPIDFDSLTTAGAMMGSGGMVVMDEDSCMVDVARYFLDFTQKESCGKCTFCRIGTRHLLDILQRITTGEGRTGDLEQLEQLSEDIKDGSLCGLGKTAPNPVLTSLKYFRDEYEAHINEKRCPGMMCRPLMTYYIDLDKCARGCDACVGCCPTEAVFTTSTRKKGIDQDLCVKCGECMVACPPQYDAVRKVSPPGLAPVIERPVKNPDASKKASDNS
ncbi:MAG: NADH-quinone oxidoreductase subunit F [Desulfobacteraceae bacterium 4572_123]|nr:MAG: NADH-quinone oxidoreductase subunit F [Desulfobacteraceae bacterium 4572_123]